MVSLAVAQGYTQTGSWRDSGIYNLPKATKAVLSACAPFKFAALKEIATDAAAEEASELQEQPDFWMSASAVSAKGPHFEDGSISSQTFICLRFHRRRSS